MNATVTTTGAVTTQNTTLQSVALTAGPTDARLVVRAGGPSGQIVCSLKAAASGTVSASELSNGYCAGGVHATLTGASPEATFDYEIVT